MRASQLYCPTLREAPAEAELASHQLLVRAGFIRPLAGGLFAYLPLGVRTLRRIERIVREEMDALGGQELCLPLLQPAELWQATGRWDEDGERLFKLRDRKQARFGLGPTHEEAITHLVGRELRSYRELPRRLYHLQTRFRDEPRPHGGLVRTREFLMKELYSFDRDEAGLEASCEAVMAAYVRILERCQLPFLAVEAAAGAVGGSETWEFLVPCAAGEETILRCDTCDYAANREQAEARSSTHTERKPGGFRSERLPLTKVETPGATTVEEVTRQLHLGAERLVKTLLYVADGQVVAGLVRGDRELNEAKLQAALGCRTLEMAGADVVERVTQAPVGFAGPVGLAEKVPILADPEVAAMANFVVGANAKDAHYVHANPGRDFAIDRVTFLRFAEAGDGCPRCPGTLTATRGLEVGHLLKLGSRYSAALGATFADEDGQERPVLMGSYRLGISRLLAAIAEVHHDDKGLVWPAAVAPFDVHLLVLNESSPTQREAAEAVEAELRERGMEVLLDERAERPGVKFRDADLIGLPIQVVVGRKLEQENCVEVRSRRTGAATDVPVAEVGARVQREAEKGRGRMEGDGD